MSDVQLPAVAKINADMQKKPEDKYREIIGHYVIDRCVEEDAAEAVLAENKSLEGAMAAVVSKARAAASGGVAVLTPNEVFAEIDGYFGFALDMTAQQEALKDVSAAGGDIHTPAVKNKKMKLSLEDFI